jgi:peroxiredoxin
MKQTLRAQTENLRGELRAVYPGEALDAFDEAAAALGRRDFASKTIRVGEQAPEFTLPEARGGETSLSVLLEQGIVVLTFYRGSWCPYCNLQLKAYREIVGELEQAGAQLVAVSPMTPDNSLSFADKESLGFAVLSDVGSAVAERYGLDFALEGEARAIHEAAQIELPQLNGDDSWRLPAPATFVIDRDGVVRFVHVDGDYRWRLEPEALLAAAREVAMAAPAH